MYLFNTDLFEWISSSKIQTYQQKKENTKKRKKEIHEKVNDKDRVRTDAAEAIWFQVIPINHSGTLPVAIFKNFQISALYSLRLGRTSKGADFLSNRRAAFRASGLPFSWLEKKGCCWSGNSDQGLEVYLLFLECLEFWNFVACIESSSIISQSDFCIQLFARAQDGKQCAYVWSFLPVCVYIGHLSYERPPRQIENFQTGPAIPTAAMV